MSDFQKRQFISQLSWNMTGCWWMKQEGRGASVWQVVSEFMECLLSRAEMSGVQYNGPAFHLTLPTCERLTFNFGFYLLLITAGDCRARTAVLGWSKCWKSRCWSLIDLGTPSLICFTDSTSTYYFTIFLLSVAQSVWTSLHFILGCFASRRYQMSSACSPQPSICSPDWRQDAISCCRRGAAERLAA